MKRVLPFILTVLLLTGCSAPAISSAPPKPMATAAVSASPESVQTPAPAEDSSDISLTDTPTPQPTPIYTLTPVQALNAMELPPLKGNKHDPALPLGTVAVSNGKVAYYYKGEDRKAKDTDGSDTVVGYNVIYKLNLATGKSTKVTETNMDIHNIFLDAQGNLYFHCLALPDDPNVPGYIGNLYVFANGHNKVIASNVNQVIRVDKDSIYYDNFDNTLYRYNLKTGLADVVAQLPEINWISDTYGMYAFASRPIAIYNTNAVDDENPVYQICTVDLKSGAIYQLPDWNGNCLFTDDGACLLAYQPKGNGTAFVLYDFGGNVIHSFTLPVKTTRVDHALVSDGQLFLIDDNWDDSYSNVTKSNIYDVDIKTGTLVSTVSTDYVDTTRFYQGKWYFYSYHMKENDARGRLTHQQLQVFNLADGTIATIAKLSDADEMDDNVNTFEVQGGYIWFYDYCEVEYGNYIYLKRIAIPKLSAAATPQPTPTPTDSATAPADTATEAPTAAATSN